MCRSQQLIGRSCKQSDSVLTRDELAACGGSQGYRATLVAPGCAMAPTRALLVMMALGAAEVRRLGQPVKIEM